MSHVLIEEKADKTGISFSNEIIEKFEESRIGTRDKKSFGKSVNIKRN